MKTLEFDAHSIEKLVRRGKAEGAQLVEVTDTNEYLCVISGTNKHILVVDGFVSWQQSMTKCQDWYSLAIGNALYNANIDLSMEDIRKLVSIGWDLDIKPEAMDKELCIQFSNAFL